MSDALGNLCILCREGRGGYSYICRYRVRDEVWSNIISQPDFASILINSHARMFIAEKEVMAGNYNTCYKLHSENIKVVVSKVCTNQLRYFHNRFLPHQCRSDSMAMVGLKRVNMGAAKNIGPLYKNKTSSQALLFNDALDES